MGLVNSMTESTMGKNLVTEVKRKRATVLNRVSRKAVHRKWYSAVSQGRERSKSKYSGWSYGYILRTARPDPEPHYVMQIVRKEQTKCLYKYFNHSGLQYSGVDSWMTFPCMCHIQTFYHREMLLLFFKEILKNGCILRS